MPTNSSGRVIVVKKEDKEAKLREFVLADIEGRAAADQSGVREYWLLARSPESPSARAVAALSSEIDAARISVTVVFSSAEPGSVETCRAWASRFSAPVRILKGASFLEAHEQLVLGPHAAWIGDCMRRDPSKRDAFELFAADCAKTAGHARTSFHRLWASAQVIATVESAVDHATDMADAVAAGAMPLEEAKPLVSSRH